jgi:predicted DCC family thiol-disulfide oxidoreductase YuxK
MSRQFRSSIMPAEPKTNWPMQVFYDGACPLCSREMRHYQRQDIHNRIQWIDIAAPAFDAASYGLDPAPLQQVMHARLADGHVVTQVAAFVKIWEALPFGFGRMLLRCLLKVPGMMAVAGVFYRLFARNRHRLTGRCATESCPVGKPGAEN